MPSQDGRRAVLPWKKAFDAHLARVGHSCWLAEPQRAQPANGLIGMNSSIRFTDVQARPSEFLDLTSLTLDEFQQLVPPFETAFQAHLAAWRLDGKPRI